MWISIFLGKCWLYISIFTGSYKHNETHIFIHPQARTHPRPPLLGILLGIHIFSVLNLDNLVEASIQLLGISCESVGGDKQGLSTSLKKLRPVTARTSTRTDLKPKTRHFLKTIGYFYSRKKSSTTVEGGQDYSFNVIL